MGTGRLEAFSDGVIAVIITIMVLDLKLPHDASWAALAATWPGVAIYLLSFVVVGIFWINHHHTLAAAVAPTPRLLWANLAVLFTLSLVPFVTAYVASERGAPLPIACYACVLGLASATFVLLGWVIGREQPEPRSRRRFRRYMLKGFFVIVLYAVAIPLTWVSLPVVYAILIAIPILYVLPDRRLAEVA